MAIARIKATYSLDTETVRLLERVARRCGVSKSEALRRAIHASAASPGTDSHDARLLSLGELQKEVGLSARDALKWERAARAERRASPSPAKRS